MPVTRQSVYLRCFYFHKIEKIKKRAINPPFAVILTKNQKEGDYAMAMKEKWKPKMDAEHYDALVQKYAPPSKSMKTIPLAFLVGGIICVIGQLLMTWYASMGADKELAGTLVSVSLVVLSAILTGIGIYDNIAKFGGAGTLVPITGFANAVVSPALEFKSEGFVLGLGAKIFIIAGPVIAYGILASIVYGVIYWAIGLFAG